jgi:hypothetical protein
MRVNTVDVTDIRSVGVENRQRTRIYSSDRWIKCEYRRSLLMYTR